jgi:hypothetical protein
MASTSQNWSRSQDVAQPQWELARARARVLQRLAERPILAAAAIDLGEPHRFTRTRRSGNHGSHFIPELASHSQEYTLP